MVPGVPSGAISKGAPAAGCALETSSVSVRNLVVGWGWLVVALLCGVARCEELAVFDNEGELPLGGWEEFARFVVNLQ